MEHKNKFELISEMMDDRPLTAEEAKMLAKLLVKDKESQQRFREYQAIGKALRLLDTIENTSTQQQSFILSRKMLKEGVLFRARAAVATTLSVVAVGAVLTFHCMQGRFRPDMNMLSSGISNVSFEMQGLSDYEPADSSEASSVAHSNSNSDHEEHDKKNDGQKNDTSISTDSDRTPPPVA